MERETSGKPGPVVLLSGGLDSVANLALEVHRFPETKPKLALTFDYGQQAAQSEITAAKKIASYYGVAHQVVPIEFLAQISRSALTQKHLKLPEFDSSELDDVSKTQDSAQQVWVSNRNGVMIEIAAAFAEAESAHRVLVGFNREEAATFPDNSKDYLKQINTALTYSTRNRVQVDSHTLEMNKREIVEAVSKLDPAFPFDWIWSCYRGDEKPCGTCESCQRFQRAIRKE